MKRNYRRDIYYFDAEKDINTVAKLYLANQDQVERFLNEQNEVGKLEALSNAKVYELIEEKFGFPVPH